jgi:hypothetical protein
MHGCCAVVSFIRRIHSSLTTSLSCQVKKQTVFFSHLYIKMMILPRQARDKHRENSKKECRFVAVRYLPRSKCSLAPSAPPEVAEAAVLAAAARRTRFDAYSWFYTWDSGAAA